MSLLKDDVRDCDHWDLTSQDVTFQGVTLKHVWDNIGNFVEIKHDERCPTPSQPSYFKVFHMETQNNKIEKMNPENGVEMPASWYDWHNEMTPEAFEREIPTKSQIEINFKHIEPNPMPL